MNVSRFAFRAGEIAGRSNDDPEVAALELANLRTEYDGIAINLRGLIIDWSKAGCPAKAGDGLRQQRADLDTMARILEVTDRIVRTALARATQPPEPDQIPVVVREKTDDDWYHEGVSLLTT